MSVFERSKYFYKDTILPLLTQSHPTAVLASYSVYHPHVQPNPTIPKMPCCSSSEDDYISLLDEGDLPMRVALSPDGRIVLRTLTRISLDSSESSEEVSSPRDPILMLIVGPGKLATSPTRVRMSLAEEEWEVSPPQDPEILAATGAGELATSPIRVREPLDSDYSSSFDGEVSLSEQRDPDAPLEPIHVLYFHPNLNEWRPWRPVVPKVPTENEMKVQVEEGARVQKKTTRKKSRWRVGLGFFRAVGKSGR